MIHVYNQNIDLERLYSIDLVRPAKAKSRWKGIQHGHLVETLMQEIDKMGWSIGKKLFSITNDGTDLVGAFDFDSTGGMTPPDGMNFALGFDNNNDRKKSLTMFVGGIVKVCTNGYVSGELILKRRHSKNLDLREEIKWALELYTESAEVLQDQIDDMKERKLNEEEWEHTLVESLRKGYIVGSRLLQLDRLYHEPPYEEHGKGTAWTAMQAFTEVVKHSPAQRQMEFINRFRKLIPTELSVIA